MPYVFQPSQQPTVEVLGEDNRFPIRRIFCVGRNYAAHAREMGADPNREPPFFFTKPADAIVAGVDMVPYPLETENFQFEAELVVAIGKSGINIPEDQALDLVWGYAIGNDLTRRDLQLNARKKGRPWDWGKAFDQSAVCGPIHKVNKSGHLSSGFIRLFVNDEIKQSADLEDLIWSVPEIISILSYSMELKPGDLIYTGTPAGVGPIVPGDTCVIEIEGLGEIKTTIGPKVS